MASYTKHDLEFILAQIKLSEADSPESFGGPDPLDLADLIPNPNLSWGLRTLSGEQNNLLPGNNEFGSADNLFPRLLNPVFNAAENSPAGFGPTRPTSYAQTSGSVFDSQPRIISNLIVDQTITNRAAVIAALDRLGNANSSVNADAFINANTNATAAALAVTNATTALATATSNWAPLRDARIAATTALAADELALANANTALSAGQTALGLATPAYTGATTALVTLYERIYTTDLM